MRSAAVYVAMLAIFIISTTCLHAEMEFGLLGFGRAPITGNTVVIGAYTLKTLMNLNNAAMYLTTSFKDKGFPEGFEHYDEPLDWWVPTGEEIYSTTVACGGVLFDVPKTNWLSIAPHIGWGRKYTYTQYVSSATGWKFYNRTSKYIADYGVDLMVYYKYFGLSVGYSKYPQLKIALFVRC